IPPTTDRITGDEGGSPSNGASARGTTRAERSDTDGVARHRRATQDGISRRRELVEPADRLVRAEVRLRALAVRAIEEIRIDRLPLRKRMRRLRVEAPVLADVLREEIVP